MNDASNTGGQTAVPVPHHAQMQLPGQMRARPVMNRAGYGPGPSGTESAHRAATSDALYFTEGLARLKAEGVTPPFSCLEETR